ncbi:hypothetical protein ACFOOK_09410 [Micromonospora krabiensis]|uniref:PknH-like extracellular domain-containing protein n=1 Tax=Micromonospora krabiensis TaxID=307121 RepID=A0A1C3NB56_9ACTN|nr:hypothetical protein [Micromonospora krabiensis]SBV29788.1 hypothetical protein GA0070620_5369 [Micromonospora krabiensis]
MSAELSDLYRSITATADGQELAHPEVVRRRADRRARVRATGSALAVALLLGGVATGGRLVFSAEEPAPLPPPADTPGPVPTGPTPSPSASPSAPTSGPSTPTAVPPVVPTTAEPIRRRPTSIPDRAFFVLAPANRTGLETALATPLLPALCAARYPSESAVVQRRARNLAYKLANTPPGSVPDGSYLHSITIYRPGRADDVLRELRQAVRSCPRQGPDETGVTWRQRLLDPGEYGDESVLFEMRAPYPEGTGEPGEEQVRLVRAVRIGDVVTVLWEQGWENTSAERAQVDADSRRAVRAVEDWLD